MNDKRTQAERDFDWGVKGWAFTANTHLGPTIDKATKLYEALGKPDERRLSVLNSIKAKAETQC